jgi:hypothetical protein
MHRQRYGSAVLRDGGREREVAGEGEEQTHGESICWRAVFLLEETNYDPCIESQPNMFRVFQAKCRIPKCQMSQRLISDFPHT